MAIFDEFFYNFPDNISEYEVDKYIRGVYFHKARQLCKNNKIDIQNISTIEYIIKELNEHDFAFVSSYIDGTLLQIVISTEKEPVELDCIDDIRDKTGNIDYKHITEIVAESLNEKTLNNISVIPNMFIMITKPKKLSDYSITNENISEVIIPIIINNNEDDVFFTIQSDKNKNHSIYRLFPEVSYIITGIISYIYNYSKKIMSQ